MSRQFPVMRGLAIVFVLLNHTIAMSLWMATTYNYAQPSPALMAVMMTLKQLGLYAVPAFLFLSGAFFAYAVQNRPLRSAYRTVGQNLLGTLWPYLIWSSMFYLVAALLLHEIATPLQYVKNLVVGYPFNFVPLLMAFYVAAPLLCYAIKRYPIATLGGILVYQILVANIDNPATLGFSFPVWMHFLAPPVLRSTFAVWGIFFPLGIAYQQHITWMAATVKKTALWLAAGSLVFYILNVLTELRLVHVPLAAIFSPLLGLLLTSLLRREMVPFTRWFENIGKRSYGLYLTNLVVLVLLLESIRLVFPWLLVHYVLLVPLLFALIIIIPQGIIALFERPPQRFVYRYFFG